IEVGCIESFDPSGHSRWRVTGSWDEYEQGCVIKDSLIAVPVYERENALSAHQNVSALLLLDKQGRLIGFRKIPTSPLVMSSDGYCATYDKGHLTAWILKPTGS